MNNLYKIHEAEYKFMKIIWAYEPINSTKLAKVCNQLLGWKKSTVYTVIKKLRERNIIMSENAIVTALVTLEDVRKYESEKIIETNFDNSLPSFLATFLDGKKINVKEVEELKKLIEEYRE